MLIRRDASLLLVVDLQEKLAPAIFAGEQVIRNSLRLLEGAGKLGVPAFVSEHCTGSLGRSIPEIRNAVPDTHFFAKTHFSCAAEPGVVDLLRGAQRPQVIVTGAECHVCVLQTAFGLHEAGFDVFVVADAASSRTPDNHHAAIERMRSAGIHIVTTEMVVFEWLQRAGTDDFRALQPLIK
jgi:nicotinamidase-related amidase